ncbi:MAG: hypothetical protein M1819_005572 [Sarea resinae]|nr:MAG: hypothetical protein M1819_005572 [Sarea resinae]
MANSGLGPSLSVREFFQRLGLSAENEEHKLLYKTMREERKPLHKQLNADRSNLKAHLRDDPRIKPNFSWAQMEQAPIDNAIRVIWATASPATKVWYTKGWFTDEKGNTDNWIIRWLLWHSFRNTDRRNNRGRNKGLRNGSGASRDSPDIFEGKPIILVLWRCSVDKAIRFSDDLPDTSSDGSLSPGRSAGGYWDPVRNT